MPVDMGFLRNSWEIVTLRNKEMNNRRKGCVNLIYITTQRLMMIFSSQLQLIHILM